MFWSGVLMVVVTSLGWRHRVIQAILAEIGSGLVLSVGVFVGVGVPALDQALFAGLLLHVAIRFVPRERVDSIRIVVVPLLVVSVALQYGA